MMRTRPESRRATAAQIFREDRLIAVVRTASSELALGAAHALAAAGIRLIEITLTVPDALSAISELSADEGLQRQGVLIGAGTVLTGDQAEAALGAGASYLVSPVVSQDVLRIAEASDVMAMPGAMTPTEVVEATRLGAEFVKLYPIATIGGAHYVRNLQRGLAHVKLVATGNIALDEIPEYLDSGVAGFGIAAPLIREDLVAEGLTREATDNAAHFLRATRVSDRRATATIRNG